MKIEKRDGSAVRRILIGLIVDAKVLGRIAPLWPAKGDGLLKSRWANLIASWCVKFYLSYGKAPGKAIEGLFEAWAERARDKETVQSVDNLISSLSDQYVSLKKEINSDYLIDLACKHLNQVKAQRHADKIQGYLDSGQVEDAVKCADLGFTKIEMGLGSGIDVLRDMEAIKQAILTKSDPLIEYDGALGEFFGDALEREGFIAVTGMEKSGKSYLGHDMVWRAMEQGRRVAVFECGDLTQSQVMRRYMTRATKRPLKKTKTAIKVPNYLAVDDEIDITFDERDYPKDLSWKRAARACQKIVAGQGDNILLRLSCHPNSTLSVPGLRSILQGWERQDWSPDVIFCDYADIMAPMNGTAETRDQINATWKALSALRMELHCLVITVTQSNAAAYKTDRLTMSNFSEDKRKYAHVTGMLGLHATAEEKKLGISRLNWLVFREGEFTEEKHVYIAGCKAIANPCIVSAF